MHPLRFLSILQVLSLASVAFLRPLTLTPVQSASSEYIDPAAPDVSFTGPIPWLHPTQQRANLMLDKMRTVISDPNRPEHRAIIGASFGRLGHTQRQIGKISANLQQMADANVRVRVTPHDVAMTRFLHPEPGPHNTPQNPAASIADSVRFDHYFHSAETKVKAQLLLRQTASYATRANTDARVLIPDSHDDTVKYVIVPAGKVHPPPELRVMNAVDVIRHPFEIPPTPNGVNECARWTHLKSNTMNMDKSADAYRVMACLCDAAIPDPVGTQHEPNRRRV